MAQTPTTIIPLGFTAPAFSLPDTISGKVKSLTELKSDKATVIMFICNHCPFVLHVKDELVKLANDYIPKGISFIAISSNDVEKYPQDGPEIMKEFEEVSARDAFLIKENLDKPLNLENREYVIKNHNLKNLIPNLVEKMK